MKDRRIERAIRLRERQIRRALNSTFRAVAKKYGVLVRCHKYPCITIGKLADAIRDSYDLF